VKKLKAILATEPILQNSNLNVGFKTTFMCKNTPCRITHELVFQTKQS